MTSDGKHPSAGFWITVGLLAVLVAYPLSIGPACWWKVHRPLSQQPKIELIAIAPPVFSEPTGMITLDTRPGLMQVAYPLAVDPIYSPIIWIARHFPMPVGDSLQWYVELWVPGRRVAAF